MSSSYEPRLNYYGAAPALFGQLTKLSQSIHASGLEPALLSLVEIRASQINGCAFCLDMHSKEAKIHGERELRLYAVPVWRESQLFTDRERAALALTEAVTKVAEHGVSDDVYAEAERHFSHPELAQLVLAIGVINTWNRIAISFRSVPGSMDKLLGLDKAGLK
ncbi:MAG: carboxymuconolactone decarboxylase family protein [Tepidisphaeraceae bacterium]